LKDLIRLQAGICRTFGNPHRLHIIKLLCGGERTAAELIEKTGISKANMSQHMAMLVNKGIVNSEKRGLNVAYSLADKKIAQACSVMQEVTAGTIIRKHEIIKKHHKQEGKK